MVATVWLTLVWQALCKQAYNVRVGKLGTEHRDTMECTAMLRICGPRVKYSTKESRKDRKKAPNHKPDEENLGGFAELLGKIGKMASASSTEGFHDLLSGLGKPEEGKEKKKKKKLTKEEQAAKDKAKREKLTKDEKAAIRRLYPEELKALQRKKRLEELEEKRKKMEEKKLEDERLQKEAEETEEDEEDEVCTHSSCLHFACAKCSVSVALLHSIGLTRFCTLTVSFSLFTLLLLLSTVTLSESDF